MKQYITKEEWESFRTWLVHKVGVTQYPCTNEYELMRWQHHLKGKPMPIAFRRDKTDRITLNVSASKYYDDYKRRKDHAGNVH